MTSLPHWYIQKNLGDIQALVDAIDRAGFVRTLLTIVPFENKVYPISSRESVLYGATNFINNAYNAGQPTFYDRDTFTYRAYIENWKDLMLNSDCEITTFEEFAQRIATDPLLSFFIRPNADDKAFAGTVLRFHELKEWYDRISHGGFTVTPDVEVVVSLPKAFNREWRLWFVDGEFITGSSYRVGRRLVISEPVPSEVIDFGQAAITRWSPAAVFALDLGETLEEGDRLGIVEASCFNSAGFYNADLDKIVEAVSAHVRKTSERAYDD